MPRPLSTLAVAACAMTALASCGSAPAASVPRTLVTLGASDVVGVGAAHPAEEGWAPVLARLLPRTSLVKVGESGWQTHQMRASGLPQILRADPDVIVVWAGPNDFVGGRSLASFQSDLAAILGSIRQTGARVYVLNLPDFDRLPLFAPNALAIRQTLPAWQAAIAAQARTHGATVIPLGPYTAEVLAHPEYLSSDGFHPSALGYRRIAEIVAPHLAP